LTSVTIPGSVTNIGSSAFSSCTLLSSVTISGNCTSIGSSAFASCSPNIQFYFWGNEPPSLGSSVFSGDTAGTVYYLPGATGWGSTYGGLPTVLLPFIFSINNGMITILGYTGPGGSVTIPTLLFGMPVTSIGSNAFYGCTTLTSITIPASVTNIGNSAFASCTGMLYVNFSGNPPVLGSGVFNGDNAATVYYGPGTSGWGSTLGGLPTLSVPFSYSINNSTVTITGYIGTGGVVTIPGVISGLPVTGIGSSAFQSCGLTSITIPNSVTNIGSSAFSACSYLTNVVLGTGITSIGSSAFSSCTSLTSVTIPNSVAIIGGSAFNGCSYLTNAILGAGITSIGSSAFSYCTRLTSVTIPGSVTIIGSSAFYYCTQLTKHDDVNDCA